MMSFKKNCIRIQSILALVVISFGAVANASDAAKKTQNLETYKMLDTLTEVLSTVHEQYVDKIDYATLVKSAIKGVLADLDPHSAFLDIKDFNALYENTSGKFGGLGMTVERDQKTKLLRVVSPLQGAPAERSGIRTNDIIFQINDKILSNYTFTEAVQMLRGKPGTKVKLKILRGKSKSLSFTLTREIIKVASVKHRLLTRNIGYISISKFQSKTTEQLKQAIKKIRGKGAYKVKGYILDLRNNPGGLLPQAISVSDVFLSQGEIVSTRGRKKETARRFNATEGDFIEGKPLVILVNAGSASAAEIVAGALQDNKRAILVGKKTFGKGSVQSVVSLGEKMGMKYTIARYYTPSGRSIQNIGITPDIVVPQLKVSQQKKQQQFRESKYRNSIANTQKQKKENNNTDYNWDIRDYELARAIDTVQTLILSRD